MADVVQRPFLKWAGGKARLVSKISSVLPDANTLVEPFVGAGSVFLNTHYSKYVLSDINQDLINIFQILQLQKSQFIESLRPYFSEETKTEDFYYQQRNLFNQTPMGEKRALLFLYLNRHGYNGLCRYNKSGGFNVPFGRYSKVYFPEQEMNYFIEKSKGVTFLCEDFETVMNKAKKGSVIYCDPPYVPLSKTASFTSYAKNDFEANDQIKLAALAKSLKEKGISTVISNHDNDFTRDLYQGAKIISFSVQRLISCKGESRNKAAELLAVFDGR